MAVARFKVALNNARFPLVSTQAERAVFIPGLDTAVRANRYFTGTEDSVDSNLAQVIFSENVMPTTHGVNSTGYKELVAASTETGFDSIFALKGEDENTVLYSPAGGKNLVLDAGTGLWAGTDLEGVYGSFFQSFSRDPALCTVSYCYVEGITFVCFSELTAVLNSGGGDYTVDASIYWWNPAVQRLEAALGTKYDNLTFAAVTKYDDLTFAAGTVRGVGSSSGYLIVYSGIVLAWAPYNDTLFDFSPYVSGAYTGAGMQIPEDIQGTLRAVVGLPGGFLAFTNKNCVAAAYHAQSLTAPWAFCEVAGAGGAESYEQITVEGTLGVCYALTTAGMQKISLNSAELVFPAVSDFLTGRYMERLAADMSTIIGSTTLDMFSKVSVIGNRYLVVSYGTMKARYTHALVYDFALERWGKLAVRHRDCFYYNYGVVQGNYTYIMVPEPYDTPDFTDYTSTTGDSNSFTAAQHGLGLLQDDGTILLADWSNAVRETQDDAVLMVGRIQLSRAANTQFNRLELDGFRSGAAYISVSTSGGNSQPAVPLVLIEQDSQCAVFGELLEGKNIKVIVEGTFQLSTMVVEATTAGSM